MSRAMRLVSEGVAMLLVGDGLVSMLQPRRHAALWDAGPGLWRQLLRPFARNPLLTVALGATEVAAGLWLASRQKAAPSSGKPAANALA